MERITHPLYRPAPGKVLDLERVCSDYLAHEPEAERCLASYMESCNQGKFALGSVREIETAVMFSDIVGSCRIFSKFGNVIGKTILNRHDALLQTCIENTGGYVVKHLGDGILAEFNECSNAVSAATKVLEAVRNHNDLHTLLAFHIRIGISVGQVFKDDGDLIGASVNLAKRLCNQAPANSVLTTGIVAKRCQDAGFRFSPQKNKHFKGFNENVPVATLINPLKSDGANRDIAHPRPLPEQQAAIHCQINPCNI